MEDSHENTAKEKQCGGSYVHLGCWEIREQGSINPDWEGREKGRFPDGAVPEI